MSTRKGGLTRTVAARLPQLVLERHPVLDGVCLERTPSVQDLVSTIAGRLARAAPRSTSWPPPSRAAR
ncbi:MAG TPA: hypothetical protein VF302_09505 [Candidatus Limnocylindrales bacterium]